MSNKIINSIKKDELKELSREEAIEEIKRVRTMELNRYYRFKKKKEVEGFSRKSFWLCLDPKNFDKLITWLKRQPPEDLLALITLLSAQEVSSRDLIKSYKSYKEINSKQLSLSRS